MTTPLSYEVVTHAEPAMGGLLEVAITVEPERSAAAAHAARRAAGRLRRGAGPCPRPGALILGGAAAVLVGFAVLVLVPAARLAIGVAALVFALRRGRGRRATG